VKKNLVLEIHKTPFKAVLAITGGGSEAIGELLRYGEGSKTLLEAVVPYDQQSFIDFVHGTPDKYCAPEAARTLAMAAFQRAIKLAGNENAANLIGIGCSASLAKDHEREGRQHHAYIAVQTLKSTTTYSDELTGQYTREQEEKIVADNILIALANACGLSHPIIEGTLGVKRVTTLHDEDIELLTGKTRSVVYNVNPESSESNIFFPGSFHPVHEGHIHIAQKVHEITGKQVNFEVCAKNVDKPVIDYTDFHERREGLREAMRDQPWAGKVFFTAAPTFIEKARLFHNSVFVVGWDTFKRLNDVKYCGGSTDKFEEMLKGLKLLGTHFMVFHRIIDGKLTAEEEDSIHPDLLDLATIYPGEFAAPKEISSTELRKQQRK
jgi:nicotinic acid mononucleotide adenylyltransferase